MFRAKLTGLALAGASLFLCAAGPAMADTVGAGANDPFEITFDANGNGTLNACSGTCSFFPGPDNGTAVTNVGGLGGNGYDFKLPQAVGTGIVDIFNSSNVLVAALDFIDSTDLVYVVSGTLSNYASGFSVTANASGNFFYLAPSAFPNGNQYNGTIPSTTPLPAALPLFASGLGGLGLLGWRRKRKAQAVA
jgi:hypothetical protein